MKALSGMELIQDLQYLWNDSVCLSSKLYTYLNKRMILVAAHKWLLENRSYIVASPVGRQIQNGLVNDRGEVSWKLVDINSQIEKYPDSVDNTPSPNPPKLLT